MRKEEARFIFLSLAMGLALTWPGCNHGGNTGNQALLQKKKPALTIFYTGNLWGELAPCG
ncbi:MAG: hypothetical protein GXP49_15895 [Deltaproteobacteria bacterium]|nr:hypothetical protein [Deltaproteobacteria bacterium]